MVSFLLLAASFLVLNLSACTSPIGGQATPGGDPQMASPVPSTPEVVVGPTATLPGEGPANIGGKLEAVCKYKNGKVKIHASGFPNYHAGQEEGFKRYGNDRVLRFVDEVDGKYKETITKSSGSEEGFMEISLPIFFPASLSIYMADVNYVHGPLEQLLSCPEPSNPSTLTDKCSEVGWTKLSPKINDYLTKFVDVNQLEACPEINLEAVKKTNLQLIDKD